jgi:hypothetical protein
MCNHSCSDFHPTCKIQWIKNGEFTPDSSPAIAVAVCHDPRSFGEKGSEPFFICEEHAKEKGKFWKLYPLPGQDMAHAHKDVQWDDMTFKVIPDKVSEAIKQAFPKDANEILDSLRWSGDHFSFNRWGMYVGVELDGYIHS